MYSIWITIQKWIQKSTPSQKISSILIVTIGIFMYRKSKSRNQIPGPSGWFGTPGLRKAAISKKLPELFQSLFNQYGPICKIRGPFSIHYSYLITDASEAKRILTDPSFNRATKLKEAGHGLFDEALFVLIGDQWKRHRKLLQPAFAPSHLKHTAKVTIETMAKLFNILDHQLKTTGQLQVNMHHIMTTCALEIIGKVAFGESLGVVDKLSTEESTRWLDLEQFTTAIIPIRFITPRWLWRFLGVSNHTYKIKTAKLNVMTYFQSIATKRSIQIANNAHPQDHEMDILYRLLLAKQKGLMTQDEIMGEIVGFFLAGHETTANTITSCIYDLCMNPEIMESVYKSVSDVDESDINHLLDQLTKLRYLDNVLKESQRLRPVITQLTRISNRTVDVLGHQFPSNTIFVLNLYAIQLDGRYYDKPMEFKPDRFDEQLEVGAFMPFGDGQHNCIGQKMAMIELKIMLVMMIKRYRISLVEGLPVEFEMSMTRGLKKGLIVNLEKRD